MLRSCGGVSERKWHVLRRGGSMVELVACETVVGEEAYSSSLELLESASCGRKTGRNRSGWRGSTEKLGYSAHCVWWSDTAERTVNLMLLGDEMEEED